MTEFVGPEAAQQRLAALAGREGSAERVKEIRTEMDAADESPEELLRAWFHWWRQCDDAPAKLPDALHVRTAAYLTVRAIENGRKVYGPQSL